MHAGAGVVLHFKKLDKKDTGPTSSDSNSLAFFKKETGVKNYASFHFTPLSVHINAPVHNLLYCLKFNVWRSSQIRITLYVTKKAPIF